MERCANGEMKIKDLEEELKVVGQSLQQLEVTKKIQKVPQGQKY